MNLLDIHFRSGKTRTAPNVDNCRCGDGFLTGYHRDGRLILRVALTSVDYFEVREERQAPPPLPAPVSNNGGREEPRRVEVH